MGSPVLKRSVVIGGHKTSVSLEDEFWSGLKEIAAARNMTLSDLVATVERGRESGNLSSTLRLFVLDSYRQRAAGRANEGQNGGGASTAVSPAPR
jgi:predicted DNA-binding ribbon-helix-helix protein